MNHGFLSVSIRNRARNAATLVVFFTIQGWALAKITGQPFTFWAQALQGDLFAACAVTVAVFGYLSIIRTLVWNADVDLPENAGGCTALSTFGNCLQLVAWSAICLLVAVYFTPLRALFAGVPHPNVMLPLLAAAIIGLRMLCQVALFRVVWAVVLALKLDSETPRHHRR